MLHLMKHGQAVVGDELPLIAMLAWELRRLQSWHFFTSAPTHLCQPALFMACSNIGACLESGSTIWFSFHLFIGIVSGRFWLFRYGS